MSSCVPLWVQSAPAAPVTSATMVDDAIVDLTSDGETSSPLGVASAPSPGGFTFAADPGTFSVVVGDGSKVRKFYTPSRACAQRPVLQVTRALYCSKPDRDASLCQVLSIMPPALVVAHTSSGGRRTERAFFHIFVRCSCTR